MPHANLSSFLPNTHTHRVTAATLVTPVVFQCHCLRLTHTPTDAQLRRARGRLRSRHGGHAVWQVSPSRRAARLFRSDARDIHSRLDVESLSRVPLPNPPPPLPAGVPATPHTDGTPYACRAAHYLRFALSLAPATRPHRRRLPPKSHTGASFFLAHSRSM
jgi:hypothetical protein